MIDQKALDILFNTYWSSAGWREKPIVSPADLAYAKSKQVMFGAVRLNHDQKVTRAIKVISRVNRKAVADGFLASLSTRRLDLRSALGSYAVGRHLPRHEFMLSDSYCRTCSICGEARRSLQENLNVLNFERFKWGGVRHDDLLYIAFDLERFLETPRIKSTPEDLQSLRKIFAAASSLPASGKLTHLVKAVAPLIRSSESERQTLIAIPGYCGILQPKSHPGFLHSFVAQDSREQTSWHKDDWPYPIQWWRGSDGVNWKAVLYWFPQLKRYHGSDLDREVSNEKPSRRPAAGNRQPGPPRLAQE